MQWGPETTSENASFFPFNTNVPFNLFFLQIILYHNKMK